MRQTTAKAFLVGPVIGLALLSRAAAAQAPAATVNLPRVEGITIDGKGDDWGDRGLAVHLLQWEDKVLPASDFDAQFRAGWDERGLLFLVTVRASAFAEAETTADFYKRDTVQIAVCDVADHLGGYEVFVSPGRDPKFPKMRILWGSENRTTDAAKNELAVTVERTLIDGGYVMEILLPWSNLNMTPKLGDEIGFQVTINHSAGKPNDRYAPRWHGPGTGALTNTWGIILAEKPSEPVVASAAGARDAQGNVIVRIVATADQMGKMAVVKEGDVVRGQGPLAPYLGRAGIEFPLPALPTDQSYGRMRAYLDGRMIGSFEGPDPADGPAREISRLTPRADASVFMDATFPKFDFERAADVEKLIGHYTIKSAFYGADFKPAATAAAPGRYGAVVDVTSEKFGTFRRFITLFRLPADLSECNLSPTMTLPREQGMGRRGGGNDSRTLGDCLMPESFEAFSRDPASAVSLAALSERKAAAVGEPAMLDSPSLADWQWWVGMRRKLYGLDERYPKPFVCPSRFDGPPATVVREATMKEAGMKEDAPQRIDAVLKDWAADSDEPFAVCVARNGVIVLNSGYGRLNGRPMRADDPRNLASIAKIIVSTGLLTVIDQGMLSLKDDPAKLLPAWKGLSPRTPLTIRDLYTHWSGFGENAPDAGADLAERLAVIVPHLKVGDKWQYGGAGMNVTWDIVEGMTGESLPRFMQNHIFEPLGCRSSVAMNAQRNLLSVPLDLARVAQLILNHGAYGNLRFYSPETAALQLPGPATTRDYGLGSAWLEMNGLSKGTFGHWAATWSLLYIDPVKQLIIVQTRNGKGQNFEKHAGKFVQTVTSCETD